MLVVKLYINRTTEMLPLFPEVSLILLVTRERFFAHKPVWRRQMPLLYCTTAICKYQYIICDCII